MATTSRSADLTSGPMLQKIILFSVPLAASSILQLLFNAADVVVVGRFAGSTALAAVGSNGSLINLLVNLFVGLSLGANVVAARCFGARDEKGVQDTVHTAVALGLVSGVLLAVVGFCAARGLLELMSCPEDVISLSTLYLKIYFIGMPMTMLYNFSSALLRAVGDTKRPLYCLAAAGIINVVLNLVFVIGFSMSVAGVALATIISQTVSALLVTGMLVREEGALQPRPGDPQLSAVCRGDRPCAGRWRSTGGAPAAALLLLGHCGHRHRRRAAAPDLRLLSAVRHHGRAGQQPARAGLQRAAHGGKPCGCVRAAAGVDRHYFPAEPHPFYAVHQLPHQLGTDRTGASGLPACGAAASAPEAAADGINSFYIKAAPGRPKKSVRRCFYYITGPHPVPSSAQTPTRC